MLLVCLGTGWTVGRVEGQTRQQRFVHLEVSASDRGAVRTQQKWMEVLTQIGADRVRSRSSAAAGRVAIEESPTSLGILIKVKGVIDGNQLQLPGATFDLRDQSELKDYVRRLKDDGADVALAEKKAFGLTSQQLVDLNDALAIPLDMDTTNRRSSDIIAFARQKITSELIVSGAARQLLTRGKPIEDEMRGLSVGTSLAAALRAMKLVLVPRRLPGQPVTLHVLPAEEADESWPVGWPSPQVPRRTVPGLFDKNNLEIRDFPLDQVLAAIESKSGVPMLRDERRLEEAGIDLSAVQVTFVRANASYGYALRKVLSQTEPRMSYEIRVDDAGRPFLWLSTAADRR